MKQKLLADAGSTKIDWALIDADNNQDLRIPSEGINALTSSDARILSVLQEVQGHLPENVTIGEIHFYGSGCSTPELCSRIQFALSDFFSVKRENVSVHSDLLAAARSLLGTESGIACILGTGSNSCFYDGTDITEHTPSLGYILGDEGSGARLGARLIADAFKGHLPEAIAQDFIREYGLSMDTVLDSVYRQPAANKYLGSFVPFLKKHLYNPYIYAIVLQEFQLFLRRNVALYSKSLTATVNFTGSIAYHFATILREACDSLDMKLGKIARSPIDGLIEYHLKNQLP